jgi:sugar phosphate isomerase/epimerase
MQIRKEPSAHLTYCLNVHPGEELADQMAAIQDHAAVIRDLVAPGHGFGLGLRIANEASLELDSSVSLLAMNKLLAKHHLYAFTINGFPYGAFHGTKVKEAVYQPDWRTPARREYTCRLARQLASLLPATGKADCIVLHEKHRKSVIPGVPSGSISTVPGSYKAWIQSAEDVALMVNQLTDTAAFLAKLLVETGREIHLGLEPEPDCYLETTAEVIAFFNEQLLPRGIERLKRTTGCTTAVAEEILRRHIGVCFDTCHLALQFEDLGASLRLLSANGIRISKIQISAAIRTSWTPEAVESLRRFCDPVYLHQVKTRVAGRPVSRGDLADALAATTCAGQKAGEEWRVHFHVPLYFVQDGPLASTADQLTPEFFKTALELDVEHFEIETYTFNVLPEALRSLGVDHSVAEEYRWVLARLPRA